MLRRLPQDQLETESKLKLEGIFNQANWKSASYTDDKFGIDGEIRIVEGYNFTGKGFKYQLKAGNSYISSESEDVIKIKIEKKYVLSWMNMTEPVVLFFYHPSQKLYWKAVQPYFRRFSSELKKDTRNVLILIDKERDCLDEFAFSGLKLVSESNFTYRKVIYSADSHEQMFTNRFKVIEIPTVCYSASTEYSDKRQITPFLEHFYTFCVKRSAADSQASVLWTFSDISEISNELRKYCSVEGMESWRSDHLPPLVFKELLNNLIFINCLQRDLTSDKRRYYFNTKVLKTKELNSFDFPSMKGRASSRTKIYVQKEGQNVEYKHHAVQLEIAEHLGNWFLEIDPDWYFTFPYRRREITRKEIGIRITKEKANTLNGDYRYLVHFWRQYLSNNNPNIIFPCDNLTAKQALIVSTEYETLESEYLLFNDYDGPRGV